MSVPLSLLAILAQGPCYGAQVRAEFDRRTGELHTTNLGQVFRALERLERDGCVVRAVPDAQGHVLWSITATGRERVQAWLSTPTERTGVNRDEVAVKVAVATTLPGTDAAAIVRAQLTLSRSRLRALRAQEADDELPVATWIMRQHEIESVDAELRWLDATLARLTEHPPTPLALSGEQPRRGRPPASVADRPVADATDSTSAHS